jgi:hypothetical protein
VAYQNAQFTAAVTGPGPIHLQWRFNSSFIPNATGAVLVLTNVQPGQAGAYSVVAFNDSGSVSSSNALLSVLIPASILQQPQPVLLRASTNSADYGSTTNRNASFSVVATSSTAIHYQ